MKIQLNSDINSIREELKKAAKATTLDEVIGWNSNTWAHLCAISAGLDPFKIPAINIIPNQFCAFLPKIDFKPTPDDRKYAFLALRRALNHVNKAIIETTKATYSQLQSGPFPQLMNVIQNSFAGGVDEFLKQLEKELFNYEKRKMYLNAGISMMTDEQIWLSKHHVFAVAILNIVATQPKNCISDEEFLNLAHDLEILNNGLVTFIPFKKSDKPQPQLEGMDMLTQALQDAEQNAQKSKQKLMNSLKKKKD